MRTGAGVDGPAPRRAVPAGSLARYRVMAYVTGVLLVLLVGVAVPLKYLADSPGMVRVVGVAHGWLYLVYVVTALELSYRARWPIGRAVLVLLAGTVPLMSFVAERWVRGQVTPAPAAAASGSPR